MDWNVTERSEHLGAAPYERRASRVGYANGFEDKTAYDVEPNLRHGTSRDIQRL